MCWERSVETLTARKDDLAGLAVASDERIEAYVLYGPRGPTTEIVSLRTFVEDGGARLKQLLSRLSAQGMSAFRFPKVHPAEISKEFLETLGFRPAGAHRLLRREGAVGIDGTGELPQPGLPVPTSAYLSTLSSIQMLPVDDIIGSTARCAAMPISRLSH